jgi:hypothetical protein
MLVLVLIALATYAVFSFRRAIAPVDDSPGARALADAERIVGVRSASSRWIRPALAPVIAWAGIMATLTPVDPSMAVWIGGLIIAVGTWAVIASIPNPAKIDDAEFDRELRNLLDQYS